MWLNETQVAAAVYAARDLVARRRLAGRPVPDQVAALLQHLLSTSEHGTQTSAPTAELDPEDLVDTGEAAEILGCTTRWVRQIRTDLDGQKVGAQWVFRRSIVVEYAAERKAAG